MQRATRQQVAQYLRAMKAPPALIAGALGNYGEGPGTATPQSQYGTEIFNAPTDQALQSRALGQPTAAFVANNNHFAPYPFAISSATGSQTILPANSRRTFLLAQNQSAADDFYFNFASDAGIGQGILLAPGVGVFFDIVCPSDSIAVFFNSATVQRGLLIEGAPVA